MDHTRIIQSIGKKLFESYNLTIQLEKKLKASQFKDLSIKDLHTIHMIGSNEKLTITEISRQLGLTRATLTSTIDKLESHGYVLQEWNPKDRRIINIILTKKGRLLYKLYNKYHKEYMTNLLKETSMSELTDLDKKLNSFIKCLKAKNDKNLN